MYELPNQSKNLIQKYCEEHDTKKSRKLAELLQGVGDFMFPKSDDDAYFLEMMIMSEKNADFKKALEDLDECLYGNW